MHAIHRMIRTDTFDVEYLYNSMSRLNIDIISMPICDIECRYRYSIIAIRLSISNVDPDIRTSISNVEIGSWPWVDPTTCVRAQVR